MKFIARKTLENLVWKHTHRDYKGTWTRNGRRIRTLLVGSPMGSTLRALEDMSHDELVSKLPRSVREERDL